MNTITAPSADTNADIVRRLYDKTQVRTSEQSEKLRGMTISPYTVSAGFLGLKAFEQFFTVVGEAFPDYELNINSLIAKGDRVMVRYTISGTHKGKFMGMSPTNEKMTITGIDVFRLENGRVIQHWDAAHQMRADNG